jgi:hypothetical protein
VDANNKAIAKSGTLINNGIINADAEATTGILINSNSIVGNAIAGIDIINNSGATIVKDATANNLLNNQGTIQGNAIAITDTLTNFNSILGTAIAGIDIINNSGAVINNGAIAGNDVINYALINGSQISAGRDIINTGNAAQIVLNKTDGEVNAKRDLLLDDGSKIVLTNKGTALLMAGGELSIKNGASINALNSGEFYALAAGNLTINTGGKLIANNSGFSNATVSAGAMFDGNNNQIVPSNLGGNLLLQKGGTIVKNVGVGNLILTAYTSREQDSAPNNESIGGQFVIEDSGSAVNVAHSGDLIIYPDALVAAKFINNKNQFSDEKNKEQYAFIVSDGGVINKNNSGDMKVTAQTVYLAGYAVKGSTKGAIEFNSTTQEEALNNARLPRYFKMLEGIMSNVGVITVSDYFLNLDPSGIKSNEAINLNIFNSTDIAYPKVLIGSGSMNAGLSTNKNFLDAPSYRVVINNKKSLNPEDNNPSLTRDILASILNAGNIMPQLPENPCDNSGQSTPINTRKFTNYIPNIGVQVPHSLSENTKGGAYLVSEEQKSPSTPNTSLECP